MRGARDETREAEAEVVIVQSYLLFIFISFWCFVRYNNDVVLNVVCFSYCLQCGVMSLSYPSHHSCCCYCYRVYCVFCILCCLM